MVSRKNAGVRVFLRNFHSVGDHSVEKREILSHLKNISSNQLFSKTVTFTKILQKFPQFSHFVLYSVKSIFFVKSYFYGKLLWRIFFTIYKFSSNVLLLAFNNSWSINSTKNFTFFFAHTILDIVNDYKWLSAHFWFVDFINAIFVCN